jgi:hypothetical protein
VFAERKHKVTKGFEYYNEKMDMRFKVKKYAIKTFVIILKV